MSILRREPYTQLLKEGSGITDIAKVLVGMRGVGKTTLLEQTREELMENGVPEDHVVHMDFDGADGNRIRRYQDLNRIMLERICDRGITYVFLDEIQNVEGWERTVAGLTNTRKCDIYIAGSNPGMLSTDLTTHIAGRYIRIDVFPFSHSEYLEIHPGDLEADYLDYLGSMFVRSEEVLDPELGNRSVR